MPNQSVIDDNARRAFLRESLTMLVRNHGPDDIFNALATVLDAYAMKYAQRTGDYDGATSMRLMATFLDGFEKFADNYDSAVSDDDARDDMQDSEYDR